MTECNDGLNHQGVSFIVWFLNVKIRLCTEWRHGTLDKCIRQVCTSLVHWQVNLGMGITAQLEGSSEDCHIYMSTKREFA